jgi:hypothetical protein
LILDNVPSKGNPNFYGKTATQSQGKSWEKQSTVFPRQGKEREKAPKPVGSERKTA